MNDNVTLINPRVRERKSGVRGTNVTGTLFSRKTVEKDEHEAVIKAYQSNQVVDPFQGLYQGGGAAQSVMPPEWNPWSLLKLPNECSVLRQCIDAMVTNCDKFGHRLEYFGPEGQEESPAARAERSRIEGILTQPNGEYTITELRERLRRDRETLGYAFLEVGRDNSRAIVSLHHVPGHTLRMTLRDSTPVQVQQWLSRDGKMVKVSMPRRFRLFVQQVGSKLVYFKEFGDPRIINPTTGKEDKSLGIEMSATEIYHISLYSPGSAYGIPRWINQLPAILGTRESELTNYQFFKDNAVPAMAVLVSGGALTNSSLSNIEEHFTSGRGRGSMNRVLVIEASGDETTASPEGQVPAPKLEIKTLTSDRQQDGMFLEYEASNEKKVRSSFRLPPLFVGRAEDYARATAETSLVVADGQVFGPERNSTDDMFNAHFLVDAEGRPNQFYRMRSNPPRLAGPEAILQALEKLDKTGALSPNVCIGIANEVFDLNIQLIEAEWGNYPFAVVLELAKKGLIKGMDDIMMAAAATVAAAGETPLEEEPSDQPEETATEEETAVEAAAKAPRRIRATIVKNLRRASVSE